MTRDLIQELPAAAGPALALEERLQGVRAVAGGVAHKFGNQLMVVLFHGSWLMDRFAEDDEVRHRAESIRAAAQQAAILGKKLTRFAAELPPDERVVDLNAVILEARPLLECVVRNSVRLDVRPSPEEGTIRADPRQLEEALILLTLHASRAAPDGGIVTIEIENRPRAAGVVLRLRTSGEGVPARIEPLPGAVREILAGLGGRIEVPGPEGPGDCWAIVFPSTGG